MREIKFRAWDKDSKEMTPLFNIDFEHNIMNKGSLWKSLYSVELLQYTWLKDKNGKEVYEGDLVIYGNKQWVIEYRPWCFYIKYLYEWLEKTWWLWYGENLEILGNIYENPELVTNV